MRTVRILFAAALATGATVLPAAGASAATRDPAPTFGNHVSECTATMNLGTWRAPAVGLLIFAAMFSRSPFVIGPAISGAGDAKPGPVPSVDHATHHS